MSEDADRFDAVVVGAGPAGSAAAYTMAQAGLSVVLVERGSAPGTKCVSGGVLYSAVLAELVPEFWENAPIERPITRHVTTFITDDASCAIDYRSSTLGRPPYNAFSVLRGKFDPWFAGLAEKAGAFLMPGVQVDGPVIEDGRVVGVRAQGDELRASVVVAADGASSYLAQAAGLRPPNRPEQVALGVKGVLRMPRETIEDRFGLVGQEGAAHGFVGQVTGGLVGGAFLYTNVDSLSVGMVVRVDELARSKRKPSQIFADLLAHPLLTPLVRDGELVEYSAHLVPEGGRSMAYKLSGAGIVVVGDAAGFAINNGLVVRGMDLAIGSGICAARTIIDAVSKGDVSARSLATYKDRLKAGFVLQDLDTYDRAPRFLDRHRLYEGYPRLLTGLCDGIFHLDGSPREHLITTAHRAVKASGLHLADLADDAIAAVRAL